MEVCVCFFPFFPFVLSWIRTVNVTTNSFLIHSLFPPDLVDFGFSPYMFIVNRVRIVPYRASMVNFMYSILLVYTCVCECVKGHEMVFSKHHLHHFSRTLYLILRCAPDSEWFDSLQTVNINRVRMLREVWANNKHVRYVRATEANNQHRVKTNTDSRERIHSWSSNGILFLLFASRLPNK